jgi:coproporphyrinogen III oxidase-like Fe-S oxidoreductase
MLESLFTYTARKELKRMQFSERDDHAEKSIISNGLKHPTLPLYVHIPFCRSLCPFCSFNRYIYNETKVRSYFAQLGKELELYLKKGYRFSSLSLGGGTPTVQMDELAVFVDKAKSMLGITEIDAESTPNEINDDAIQTLRSCGVKRLSIGVQSFDDTLLKDLGRSGYKGSGALEKIKIASGKFDTVGIDLIFNFPSQKEKSFLKDIQLFKSSGVDQATFYPIMPGPHKSTLMEKKFKETISQNVIGSRREKHFYDIIKRNVLADGYHPLSVWCFSKKQTDIHEYIVDNPEYVGVGSGSITLLNNAVYVNSFSLEKYSKYVSAGSFPIVKYKILNSREFLIYKLLICLFSMGIKKPQRGSEESRIIGRETLLLRLLGAIKADGDIFRVTEKGMYNISVMMEEFLSAVNDLRETCIEMQI